jgi:hypothetical protein
MRPDDSTLQKLHDKTAEEGGSIFGRDSYFELLNGYGPSVLLFFFSSASITHSSVQQLDDRHNGEQEIHMPHSKIASFILYFLCLQKNAILVF